MHTSFVPFEYERIANILSTFLALHSFMNKFFVISQFDQSPVSTITLITFVRCTFFMFHFDMFSIILLHFENFVTVRALMFLFLFLFLPGARLRKVIPQTLCIDF
jgi:hypothetical protein